MQISWKTWLKTQCLRIIHLGSGPRSQLFPVWPWAKNWSLNLNVLTRKPRAPGRPPPRAGAVDGGGSSFQTPLLFLRWELCQLALTPYDLFSLCPCRCARAWLPGVYAETWHGARPPLLPGAPVSPAHAGLLLTAGTFISSVLWP